MAACNSLLVAAGLTLSSDTLTQLCENAERVIAVDGGLKQLRSIDCNPQYLIGDLDSCNQDDLTWATENGAQIFQIDNQENTDLTKAISFCENEGWLDLHIVGIEGGRIDHFLGGAAAMHSASKSLKIGASFSTCELVRLANLETQVFPFYGTFSVFCFGNSIISLTGSNWELENEMIDFTTRGISNQATGWVELTLHEGDPIFILFNHQ